MFFLSFASKWKEEVNVLLYFTTRKNTGFIQNYESLFIDRTMSRKERGRRKHFVYKIKGMEKFLFYIISICEMKIEQIL